MTSYFREWVKDPTNVNFYQHMKTKYGMLVRYDLHNMNLTYEVIDENGPLAFSLDYYWHFI